MEVISLAIENDNITHGTHIVSRKRSSLFYIEEQILRCNFNSLGLIAKHQIVHYYKQLYWYPHRRSTYVKLINLIILDEILFKIFNLSKFLKFLGEKSEVENE